MKQNTLAALIGAAFFLMLGIVGAVEQGAPLSRLWWLLPLSAVLIVCVGKAEKTFR